MTVLATVIHILMKFRKKVPGTMKKETFAVAFYKK